MATLTDSYFPPPRNWDALESLVLDVFTQRLQNPALKRYGRSGQEQSGVDVFGPHQAGGFLGIQCKNHPGGNIPIQEVKKEIAKAETFTPSLSYYIIATSAPRDASVASAVSILSEERRQKAQFTVEIFFWEDICHELARHHALVKVHFPELSIVAAEPHQPRLTTMFASGKTSVTLAADWEYQPPKENKKSERIPPRYPGGRGISILYPFPMWYTPGKTPGTVPLKFLIENQSVTEAKNVELNIELPGECRFITVSTGEMFYPTEKQKTMKKRGGLLTVQAGNLLHRPAYCTDTIYAVFPEPEMTYQVQWSVTAGNMLGEARGTLEVVLQDRNTSPSRRFPDHKVSIDK